MKTRDDNTIKLDLTPFLDTVFIACIFCITIFSYTSQISLQTNTPDYSGWSWCCDGCKSLLVNIDKKGNTWINDRRVENRDLEIALKAAKYYGETGMGLAIRVHEESKVETYVSVLDAANKAAINNVQYFTYQ